MHFSRIKNYIRLIFGDKRIILLSVLIITAIPFLLFYGKAYEYDRYKLESSGYEDLNMGERSIYWEQRISLVGAGNAYNELSKINGKEDSTGSQHENAHVFGAALYKIRGIDGFNTCDSQFLYGCFHEFVGRAIAEGGISATGALNKTCLDELGDEAAFCQHGIGHGIQAYIGYEDEDNLAALFACQELPDNDPIGGCYGGIFMEYNLRTMLGDDSEVRTSNDFLHPCNKFSGEFANSCVFWAPQWWRNGPLNGFGSEDEVYEEMGRLCDMMEDSEIIENCYRGVGNIIAPGSDFEVNRTRKLCEATSTQLENQFQCKMGAVGRSLGSIQKKEVVKICEGMTGIQKENCEFIATSDLKRVPKESR